MSESRFSYQYRPYYFDPEKGPKGYLIDFFKGSTEEGFITEVVKAIYSLSPNLGTPEDKWPLTETWIELKTSIGDGHFMIDEWGLIFLEGPSNLLNAIDEILILHPEWEKIEINECDFHHKKDKE